MRLWGGCSELGTKSSSSKAGGALTFEEMQRRTNKALRHPESIVGTVSERGVQ